MTGGIAPLVGESDQTSVVTVDNSKKSFDLMFGYRTGKFSHYQIVENIRLISRHIIELAESPILEVTLMRNNLPLACEEIFLNFVAAHFYPELRSKIRFFRNRL